jgi:hypothetical protein
MLHAGLDLSRRKLDVCVLSEQGEHIDQLVVPLTSTHFERSQGESTRFTTSTSARSSSR